MQRADAMGVQEKSQVNSNSMQRVKFYRMNDDGKWDDQGTGHVTVDYLERSEELGLFVIGEEDNETLLLHRIMPEDIYRKQEDTIISWRGPDYATELALSFQETTGCSYIWDHICNVQRNLQFSTLNSETFHNISSELRELPAVELCTLPLILKTLSESGIADQMRLIELLLNNQEFFGKLMDLFRICEDLENIDGLHMIFKIVRGIIMLNSPQIFEKVFGDELIMDIIGALEYDPEVLHVQHHRSFLKEHVVFKEAIPIKDPLVLSKIHQTYRVGYLKDVVLARVLDEATVTSLNSIIHTNNAIVVSLLKDDSTFIQELFARLRAPSTLAKSKKKLVFFLHEFCSLSKSLQLSQWLRLFRDLVSEGILEIIAEALQNEDKKLVLTGTDILILFMNRDSKLLRSYLVRQEGIPLLGLLVKGMLTDFKGDMHCQFLEILRSLLETENPQRDNIIEIFYEKHLSQLIDVIRASCPTKTMARSSDRSSAFAGKIENQTCVKPEILSNICELLCFCVLHHPYRIKCNFLLNNVIEEILLLTKRKEKYIVVAAVRFVRTILLQHDDEHLINHFVKNNLLKPIIDAFVSNGNRYNLLNSAVLELFEFIRTVANLKSLLKYIVDSFWNELVKFDHLASVKALKIKYDQCLDNTGANIARTTSDPRRRIDQRALEKEEEDYFNGDSDEEDTASASQSPKVHVQSVLSNGVATRSGLVDYDDDEDEEDYRPPPEKEHGTSEEDEAMEVFRLKRKLPLKDKEPELAKKQRLGRNSKSREGVFAALCSPLSHAVLPSKKNASTIQVASCCTNTNKDLVEENHQEKDPTISRNCSDNSCSSHGEKEPPASRSCSDCLHTLENRQLSGDDCPLIPPKSSSEMTVNGS
ncbi:hypothetical protein K2173_017488 [Erythroxylum novogranatense]|uniref:Serine/threonine-protein phosphatase 4 regulatory subunit 3-like central domain-containing protein n=1 Tax=Erythroxylum novogranatense TaxID=1862640 RepID=A0AAV8TNG4_9ROSI|nr:hypothetical protein K2173_017488 [Erythroxylum novogranatense]